MNTELFKYYSSTKAGMNEIFKAAQKLPKSEVEYLLQHKEDRNSDDELVMACQVAFIRLTNRICNTCYKKDDIMHLRPCGDCGCTWYCDEKCRMADLQVHKKWCCKPDAERDMGPLSSIFVKVK
jgi:hypothetical protein